MKVQCVRLFDANGQIVERSAWMTLGAVYHVLSIWIEKGKTRFRIVGDEPAPALFEMEMFEIVSSAIPETWVITSPQAGCLSLAPAAWTHTGFWEDFFEGKPEAVASVEQERKKILASDP